MSTTNYLLPDHIHRYLLETGVREPEVARELRAETERRPDAEWSSPPELGQFLAFLVEITGARTILELGTFTGYGALWMALSLPRDGRLVTIDVNEDAQRLARRYWMKAGVADRIDLRVGEVRTHLPSVAAELGGTVDLAFIDADKPGYPDYFAACLAILRPGGLMVFDNVFQRGSVTAPGRAGAKRNDLIINEFNRELHSDSRVSHTILAMGDGVALVRKR